MNGATQASLIYPIVAHLGWVVCLYGALTLMRAPSVWGVGKVDGQDPFKHLEPRVRANLRNQFEWPIFFYLVVVLQLIDGQFSETQIWLAWMFVLGRVAHTIVQIGLDNVRLRGSRCLNGS